MPHMRFFIDDPFDEKELNISGDEARHIQKVMRASLHDALELINGRGKLAIAHIVGVEKKALTVALEEVHFEEANPNRFILFQAMPKMPHLNLIVEKCTELGLDEIVLFESQHSEKKGLSTNQIERLQHVAIAATKQCGRLYLPKIRLGELKEASGTIYYGDFHKALAPLPPLSKEVTFVNGPERGFSKSDLTALQQLDGQGISLGRHVMRTETAAICATALFRFNHLT